MATKADKKHEDWMQSKWRPAMGWLYMATCAFDFVIFPVLHAIYIALIYKGAAPAGVPMQWQPLTLQGAGLYHLAMGAVLGVAAWSRGQEKIAGAAGGTTPPGSGFGGTPGGFATTPASTPSWGSTPASGTAGSGWGSTPSAWATQPATAPQPLPPPPTKPGVRLSQNASARTVLPDTDDDPDLKIK